MSNIDISRAPLGDLAGLGEIYPELEDVILRGRGDVQLGDDLALPRARRFALRTSTMTRRTLDQILRASWPALDDLELWFGEPDRGYGAEIDDPRALAALLDRTHVPALRTLRLMNAGFADALPATLAGSALARRIEILDVSLGAFSDDGMLALARRRLDFPALRSIRIADTCVTPAGIAHVDATGQIAVDVSPISPCHTPVHWKTRRYASVSE